MSEPLPLAAAAARLRGRPGRPRRGTDGAQSIDPARENSGARAGREDSKTDRLTPLTERRLLDVRGMCAYLSLGDDTIRELGTSRLAKARVTIPGPGGGKVLFDRLVVDQIVAGWRSPA